MLLLLHTIYEIFFSPHYTFIPSSLSLYLLRRTKERGGKKAGGEALESLEAQLRGRAARLGLLLEQKTKAMKQRDKKVTCTAEHMVLLPAVFHFWNSFLTLNIAIICLSSGQQMYTTVYQ